MRAGCVVAQSLDTVRADLRHSWRCHQGENGDCRRQPGAARGKLHNDMHEISCGIEALIRECDYRGKHDRVACAHEAYRMKRGETTTWLMGSGTCVPTARSVDGQQIEKSRGRVLSFASSALIAP